MTEGSVTMQTSFSQRSVLSSGSDTSNKNRCWEKFKKVMNVLYSYVRSIVGLLFILVVYSIIGAFIFRAIEAPHEKIQKKNIIMERQDMIDILVNLTKAAPSVNESHFTSQISDLLKNYEKEIYKAYKSGITTLSTETKWDFLTALFYCGTVFTTVGYGHIAPATKIGRIITIIYAIIGIPLTLITLADLGKRFTFGIKFLLALFRQLFSISRKKVNVAKSRKTEDYSVEDASKDEKIANGTEIRPGVKVYFGYEIDTEFNLSIFVALAVAVVYTLVGAGMYMLWEDWTYLESVYFIFISISTIGFGDVMPAHPRYFMLSFVYVFIGLSLISMCINVAIQFVSQQIDRAKVNIEKATELAKEKACETIHDVNKTITKVRGKINESKKKAVNNSGTHDQNSVGASDEITTVTENGSHVDT